LLLAARAAICLDRRTYSAQRNCDNWNFGVWYGKAGQQVFMTDEQVLIINFLQFSPETWFARKEIARRAVRRKVFEENPHWADAALAELVAKGEVEENNSGQVRLKGDEELP
jgi:hypothetical protein